MNHFNLYFGVLWNNKRRKSEIEYLMYYFNIIIEYNI